MDHYIAAANNVCYNCTQLAGMLGTVALETADMSVQVTSDQGACVFYVISTSSPDIIATVSAGIFTITND